MYRKELRRVGLPHVLWAVVVDDDSDMVPMWRDGVAPVGWPYGFEWTIVPLPGSRVEARTWRTAAIDGSEG